MPHFKSPMKDNGYDIADYSVIDPIFGDNNALDKLISEAKKRDIKILLDLVLNHSSDEHPWFKAAIEDPNSPYADYYIFKQWINRPLIIYALILAALFGVVLEN